VCSFSGICKSPVTANPPNHQLNQFSNSTKSSNSAIPQIHQISNSAIKAIKAFPKTDHSIHLPLSMDY
jgi:hypothetical protein